MSVSSLGNSLVSSPLCNIWRGHGGGIPTTKDIEFDKQLDQIALWLETWNHKERCSILKSLLRHSNYRQFQFLWTVVQPVLHRDFMYHANKVNPHNVIKPVSTYTSRKYKEKLRINRQDNFYRVGSVHLQGQDDIRKCYTNETNVKFALSNSLPQLPLASRHNLTSASLEEVGQDSLKLFAAGSALYRFIEMPVRRHLQKDSPISVLQQDSPQSVRLLSRKSLHRRSKSESPHILRQEDSSLQTETLVHWYSEEWDDLQRNEFLHKLIMKLKPAQHHFISTLLTVKNSRDFISLLPESIALKILEFFNARELVVASQVSKTWYRLCNTNVLWKQLCRRVHLTDVSSITRKDVDWKKIYRKKLFLKQNWNTGNCSVNDLKGHTQKILSVTLDRKRIASGSLDKTIRIWDIKTGHLLHTLKGHTKGVWCLKFFTDNLLISGSYDATIKVWNVRTGTTARTLLGHDGAIWTLAVHEHMVVTGSQDKTAKVWDISRCILLHTLVGHSAAIFAVDLSEDGKMAITGSADRSVRLWNIETGEPLKAPMWVSPSTSVMTISYSKGYLACSYGEVILLYELKGSKLIRTYKEHQKRIEALQLKVTSELTMEGQIVSAGKDGTVKYWSLTEENSIQTFTGHRGSINCIAFDDLRMATASSDHKIKMWDFNS